MVAGLLRAHVGLRSEAPVAVDEARLVAVHTSVDEGRGAAVLRVALPHVLLLPLVSHADVGADAANARVFEQKGPGAYAFGGEDTTADILIDYIEGVDGEEWNRTTEPRGKLGSLGV